MRDNSHLGTHIFLICIGLFLQKSPIIHGFFAERDLQVMAHTRAKTLYIDFSCVCEVTRSTAATHGNAHCNWQCPNLTRGNMKVILQHRFLMCVCEVTRSAAATHCNAHCNLHCNLQCPNREVGGWGRDPFSRNFMKPTPRRKWYLTTGRRFH